jgi:uncharacterized protein YpmS
MPTVLREGGFEIMIYRVDHLPKHVHCFAGDSEVIISLETLTIRNAYDANASVRRRALKLVSEKQEFLLAEWERISPVI